MASLADLKKLLADVFLGSREFNKAADLGNALKAYDPDLEITHRCVTQPVVDALKARRAALGAKLNDLSQATDLAKHSDLEAIGDVLEAMSAAKVKKMTPEHLEKLNVARKADLVSIETDIIKPAMDKFLKKHQKLYEFVGGKMQALDQEEEEEAEEETPIDAKIMKQADKDTEEIIAVLAAREALFGAKSPLNAGDLKTFTKDKLSFLPSAVRGGDTKKLLAEEKLAAAAAVEFEKAHAKSLGIFNNAYENLVHNGKVVRSGPTPYFLWTKRASFVAQRDLLVKLLGKLRMHLDGWMAQRTTAKLDLKSKKFIACVDLAGQVDTLSEAYKKVI